MFLIFGPVWIRVGNIRQKFFSAEDWIDGTFGLFRRNSSCSAEQKTLARNSVQNRSAGEKNARNSVPWNKKRSKLSEFRSEPFRGTENSWNSIPSAEDRNAQNSVPKHVPDKNMQSILIAGTGLFVQLIFFMTFSSFPSLGIDSSVNLGMPWDEHNNGSHSESIRRNFFRTKFRCQPECGAVSWFGLSV